MRIFCAIAIALTTACAPPIAPTPSPTATASAAVATPTTSPLATSSATTWATICGTVGERVYRADGESVTLTSPGRSPLKVAFVAPRWTGGGMSGYVCIGVDQGVPDPLFAGFLPGGATVAGFVNEGTYPATMARPAPPGFVLPQACAFVRPPEIGADQTSWWVDCGAEANRSARGTLGTALGQQGWTSCGPAAATELFFKGTVRIVVVESSLAPGDYPRFSQELRPATGCR
ncbi:MAG TPA: hypothetical protein VGA38_10450 [Candidatus Limnocylindria bacterium]